MTAPLIQGASGAEGEKLTYASINENNKEAINKQDFEDNDER